MILILVKHCTAKNLSLGKLCIKCTLTNYEVQSPPQYFSIFINSSSLSKPFQDAFAAQSHHLKQQIEGQNRLIVAAF